MSRIGRKVGALSGIGIALLVALVLPAAAGAASAAPVAAVATPSATQQWAYGGQDWVNVSFVGSNVSYNAHAYFGWQVIYTATNTSNTTIELEAQRAMAATLTAQVCTPNCGSPVYSGNLSVKATESSAGFANLTTQSTVYENGTSAAAIGLVNASAQSQANLTEALTVTWTGLNGTHTASASLSVQGHAQASVAFAPSLGLVPWTLSPGLTWNSSAPFTASGSWAVAYHYARTFGGHSVSGSGNPSGTVNASGTVALMGRDLGNVTLRNGQTVPVIALELSGPFDDEDGFILVPHDFDMFGSAAGEWNAHAVGGATVTTARLDVVVDGFHHLKVVAAASNFGSQDSALQPAVSTTGLAAQASPVSGTSPSLVQAQPETVTQAQRASACLTGSCVGTSSSGLSILPLLVIGLVIAAVVGTVGVIEYRVWARRQSTQTLVGGYNQVPPQVVQPPPPPPTAQEPPRQP